MAVETGWLCVGGIELIHDARVMSYLYRGLAGANMAGSIAVDTHRVVEGYVETPYEDPYDDDYGELAVLVDCADGFEPVCLQCACPVLTLGETYLDPETDDAPWFQAASPQSAEFLGATATLLNLTTPVSRSQEPRTRHGGFPSPQRLLPRLLQVEARLYASSAAGMEWGRRWFTDVLSGDCGGGSDAMFLPYCPSDDQEEDSVYRFLGDTVLVDGPTFVDAGLFSGFRAQDARFQLGSSSPWLMGIPRAVEAGSVPYGTSRSALIETEDWGGGLALRFELSGRLNGLRIRAVPLASDQDCPLDGGAEGSACSEFVINGTQDGDTITIDAARRTATLFDITSKSEVSAIPYLEFDGPFPWIEAPPCSRMCVTIYNDDLGTAEVSIETVLREL